LGEVVKNPRVIISGAITDDGMDWAVFCYLCGVLVSNYSKDAEDLRTPLNIHKALHEKANDEV
jgi:hypothetical protein